MWFSFKFMLDLIPPYKIKYYSSFYVITSPSSWSFGEYLNVGLVVFLLVCYDNNTIS